VETMRKLVVVCLILLLLGNAWGYTVIAEHNTSEGSFDSIEKPSLSSFTTDGVADDTVEWTFMFYDDADFSSAYDPLADFSKDAFSSENLHVLVLQDTNKGPATLWYIDENHEKKILEELGEVNMGDYRTLKDFIMYSKEHFPAERYLLAMYNHGGGWMGACTDVTDNGWLTMHQIHRAIFENGGIDIICFTAPCLMGSLEAVYELRDVVDVYVGSEELSGFIYWRNTIHDLCNLLNNETSLTNYEIGMRIIDAVETRYINHFLYGKTLTMSAIRTDKIAEVAAAVDQLSQDFLNPLLLLSYQKIKSARTNAFQLAEAGEEDNYDLFDLYGFLENLQGFENGEAVKESLHQAIIAECHGFKQEGCHGLSIYFPNRIMNYGQTMLYRDEGEALDFARDTLWDEFITLYVLLSLILG
jgi:hypothetical protein